jgi:Cu/Ag efflux pump CusA
MNSGLIAAAMLTLIVVPSLYAIFVENFKMSPVPKALVRSK